MTPNLPAAGEPDLAEIGGLEWYAPMEARAISFFDLLATGEGAMQLSGEMSGAIAAALAKA